MAGCIRERQGESIVYLATDVLGIRREKGAWEYT